MMFDPSAPGLKGGIFGLPQSADARIVLIPVPWEATVSYGRGTADGPAAILAASRQVDLQDRDTGRPYEAGIAMLDIPHRIRAASDEARRLAEGVVENGGAGTDPALRDAVTQVNALGGEMNAWVRETAEGLLAAGKLVGVVGGDHSAPFGAIQALSERHPGLGILHVDAHADLREAYEGFRWSHASIMNNVVREIPAVSRIVQVGVRDYCLEEEKVGEDHSEVVKTYFDPDMRRLLHGGETWSRIAGRIVADLPREVYVSFDIDGLDPALCPHTGTPVPGGLSFPEAVTLLRTLVESGRRIVGFDLCEVAPDPEGRSEWDGNVGARILYKEVGFTLLSQRER